MAEEQAWLVRGRTDSETSSKPGSFGSLQRTMTYTEATEAGVGEPGHVSALNNPPLDNQETNESGELIDLNESAALAQQHEDALRQAGCGVAQLRVLLATGLAVMGSSLELAAIPFILPSAEIELCILPHEKSWLVTISVCGLWLGGAGWGALAARSGRRRALLSALAVNALFATIAAFMPTYGTAMMARFCSAIGSGGIIPTVFSYLAEFSGRAHRRRALAPLLACMALGGLYASLVAHALVPHTGADTLRENRQHFSAWHRYLLLCTLPILAALVCLIWTQESPRYLLEVGREPEACAIYQNIQRSNQFLVCGKKNNVATAGSDYRLGELALPGKRRAGPREMRHSVKMFWHSFFQLFSGAYRATTFTLGGTLFLTLALQFYLSAYVPTTVLRIENEQFELSKVTYENRTFENELRNETVENVEYVNCSFYNVTFRDMFMMHVLFRNCSFLDVTLLNIKTSYTWFEGVDFVNSSLIDTDISPARDFDASSRLVNTPVRGTDGACGWRAPPGGRPRAVWTGHVAAAGATLAAAAVAPAPLPPVSLGAACVLLSPAILFAASETFLYAVEAGFRFLVTLLFFHVTVTIVESYPAGLRCTAHGLLMSTAYVGALIAREVGSLGPAAWVSALICALLGLGAAAAASKIKPSQNYLL